VIKVIIFAVIGLVVGLGGGSGFSIMKAKKAAAAAHDSTAKGDSTLAGKKGEGHETASAGEGKEHASTDVSSADSAALTAHVAEPKHETPAAPVAGGHEATPNATKPVAAPAASTVAKAAAGDSSKAAQPGRIAKIFAAMSAKDAARVLEKLDDSDVQTVLSGLNDKQAAAILSGFPPERAAAISRAAIRGKKGA
jgi:flagellar motility protein MotE (MotC chaperone)